MARGTGGKSATGELENSKTKSPLAKRTQVVELGQGVVRGQEAKETVVLGDKDRMVPRGQDEDQGQTGQVGVEARLVPRGLVAVRGRTGRGQTGLGRMDRRGEEVSEEATFRRGWVSCLSE